MCTMIFITKQLVEQQINIVEKPKEEKDRRKEEERLYDNQEVCQLLRISKRTLQRYRNNGALKFHSIYHKTYYKESDLHEFIRNNFDENEIKRQARKDKLSETYPMPEEADESCREKETEDKELSDDCG